MQQVALGVDHLENLFHDLGKRLDHAGQFFAQGVDRSLKRGQLCAVLQHVGLAQGGMGVVGRLPIFLSDSEGARNFWGFTYVTLRFPESLDAARLPLLRERGYAYELWRVVPDTGVRQRIEGWNEQALTHPVERTFQLPNGVWTLSVAPVNGWVDTASLVMEAMVGVLVSGLLAYLAWLL